MRLCHRVQPKRRSIFHEWETKLALSIRDFIGRFIGCSSSFPSSTRSKVMFLDHCQSFRLLEFFIFFFYFLGIDIQRNFIFPFNHPPLWTFGYLF